MNLFERDIAVDMGTSSTLLFEQGKGVVARTNRCRGGQVQREDT